MILFGERVEVNTVCHREAVDSMDGLQCSAPVLRRLKSLVKTVLKDPRTWTGGQVFDLGNIIGLLLALFYRRNIGVVLRQSTFILSWFLRGLPQLVWMQPSWLL